MRLEDYKAKMRVNRGRLTSMDAEMEDLWTNGTIPFREFSLHTKCLGISKLAWIANFLEAHEQLEFIEWVKENNPNKLEIETKLSEY